MDVIPIHDDNPEVKLLPSDHIIIDCEGMDEKTLSTVPQDWFMSSRSLASLLGKTTSSVTKQRQRGKGPTATKLSRGRYGYQVRSVMRWLQAMKVVEGKYASPDEFAAKYGLTNFEWAYLLVADNMAVVTDTGVEGFTASVAQFLADGGLQKPFPAIHRREAWLHACRLPGFSDENACDVREATLGQQYPDDLIPYEQFHAIVDRFDLLGDSAR